MHRGLEVTSGLSRWLKSLSRTACVFTSPQPSTGRIEHTTDVCNMEHLPSPGHQQAVLAIKVVTSPMLQEELEQEDESVRVM